MLRASVVAIAASAMVLTACEDMFSLTPMEEQGSFEVRSSLSETDRAFEAHGLKVSRDPKPKEQVIPRDYLATVGAGRCLLMVEGSGQTGLAQVKVTLGAARGSTCDRRMRALFTDLRTSLRMSAA